MSHRDNRRKIIRGGLEGKIFLLCIMLVVSASICFAVLGIFRLKWFEKVADDAGKHQADIIESLSTVYIMEMTSDNMQEIAKKTASAAFWDIWIMQHDTKTLAEQVKDVFKHPDIYEEREVYGPKKENGEELSLQLLMAEGAEPAEADLPLI